MSFTTEKCPHCGQELSIPDSLDNVICMYCGKNFVCRRALQESLSDTSFDEELKKAYDTLSEEVTLPRPTQDVFTRKDYPAAFDHYCECFEDSLEHLDNALELCPDSGKEAIITEYGNKVVLRIIDRIDAEKGRKKKMEMQFLCARHMVAFAVPAVNKHSGLCSKTLSEVMVNCWNSRFKGNKITSSTFEQINQGFHERYRFCYITTAVCEKQGKPDDCYELQTLRSFRDGYLMSTPFGKQEIAEYYLFAPMILQKINDDGEYDRIYDQYIKPCVSDIENGEYEQCHRRYSKMVSELRSKWFAC